ncbi:ATP-cone domain protein [Desulfurobacterium thermolithotrophum DSM 11699]|uniref:ATP-cone domain protein n=1 Tax=Desulfurobacterium thermolithotrophum (strain DSM 11699 / BSA) TaxID=868864 RepID=F0S0U3_DESTD|nr:ATP cone domain-containing protein [Desulfurobacterium thermolithotrophum]ADY72747.1 ATP-cone domain protein [Desulfurobacterium thermolithotrophum DSM 11699]
MAKKEKRKRYVIDSSGEKYPFSKGVLVRSLTKTGLSINEAYNIADEVAAKFKGTITSEDLTNLVFKVLKNQYGKKIAEKYKQLVEEKEILVVEADGKTFVPFSRGILAGSIRSAGVDTQEAFEIAKRIADYLRRKGKFRIKRAELRDITVKFLKRKLGKEYAQRYLLWRQMKRLDKPVIILIGGATGVGKSKLAAELAGILEINRMASTDSIREVMRKMISKELVPSIHVSSYEAGDVVYKFGEMEKEQKILYGFLDQTEKVLTGVEAVINRAIKENISLIVEGIHLIPGVFDRLKEKAYVIHLILTTLDEEIHKSRFKSREKVSQRTSKKYLRNFKAIRLIQDYLYKTAAEKNIPIVENIDFDQTREKAIEIITEKMIREVGVKI